ncbi:Sodium/calcium exchanger protein-domain-containing protein [Cercophora newfieldiana]|uniref:Sodium/calcium exchanger protein-domain-containing protein n=1 Tax=Cercophora newfieldiana TaxID=92897 RepID=A0AA39YS98_9PEZI|nr:Sodium/calcium exchanger protein-domain-containing protein [Cercophora newfieldiana]
MKETSNEPQYTDPIPLRTRSHGGTHGSTRPSNASQLLPVSNATARNDLVATPGSKHAHFTSSSTNGDGPGEKLPSNTSIDSSRAGVAEHEADGGVIPPPGTSPQTARPGSVLSGNNEEDTKNVVVRFLVTTKTILQYSKLNLLLVFVPIGIVVGSLRSMPPGLIFAMNAVAIIPLAGLLSYATETVASRLGDSFGALLNITFGNAVELIIFIALAKDEIRIVQASLLGSILANLLLILGMSFLLGGLRFREQIYNSTVTQMSACLLSLSVISLVLPTAFHASFRDSEKADIQSLKISRGTSVILLLVYIIYLLFQLVSHAYMYESTPQHIIDEEATPGPVANWLDSSTSDSHSSSDSDSPDSEHSRGTVRKRMKRVMRRNRRRKSSVVSVDTTSEALSGPTRTPSFGTSDATPLHDEPLEDIRRRPPHGEPNENAGFFEGNESAIEDDKDRNRRKRRRRYSRKKHQKHKHKGQHSNDSGDLASSTVIGENSEAQTKTIDFAISTPADNVEIRPDTSNSVPVGAQWLRGVSLRPLAPAVFVQPHDIAIPAGGRVPHVRLGIRRTNSLPDRLNQYPRPPEAMMPSQVQMATTTAAISMEGDDEQLMSRTSAIWLLLMSTALVAVCAEFMVDSINGLVESNSIGEIFIGLIILPIVGNAAEHVTAITVAMKNKMDLAIGVAVGSSIQIALFITPLIVIIGWIMDRKMTLYFTLFETVCLFVSTFITNFLVLDGRSNYLEGALLVATYVIISVVAFFYPQAGDASSWGA